MDKLKVKDGVYNIIIKTDSFVTENYDLDELMCIYAQLTAIANGWGMDFSVKNIEETLVYKWENPMLKESEKV